MSKEELKRKRKTIRGNVTRFSTDINNLNDDFDVDDVEYIINRLASTLKDLKIVDGEIHKLCTDEEYDNDITQCETYTDTAELAIFKATKIIQKKTPSTINANNNFSLSNNGDDFTSCTQPSKTTPVTQTYTVKLPTIKLEPFGGDIEDWQSFWEQFDSAVNSNPNLSTIDKHVFLRGYLQGEPKRLVDGISIIAETYETTKKLLVDKYGDKNRIVQAHLDFLENLPPLRNQSAKSINEMYIECNRRIQALRALGENIDAYGRVITPKILRAFPQDICCRWIIYAKRQDISESDLTQLLRFLSEEVEGAMTTLKIKGDADKEAFTPTSAFNVNTKSTLETKKKNYNPFCAFCESSGHWAQNCETITDYNIRRQKLKDSDRCFLCINRGHKMAKCPRKHIARCRKCKKQHHESICPPTTTRPPTTNTIANSEVHHINAPKDTFTHLQTARVYVTGPTGLTKLTRCILDGGSQTSFVDANLIDRLKLSVMSSEQLNVHAFESPTSSQSMRRSVKLSLSSLGNTKSVTITAFESSNTYTSHPAAPVDIGHFARSRKMILADPPGDPDLPIELLIGGDFYWHIVTTESPIKITESLALVPSIFGWVLNGSRTHTTITNDLSVNHISVQNTNLNVPTKSLDDLVRDFWDLESIGIQPVQEKTKSRDCDLLTNFNQSFKVMEGRRVVKLPWKQEVELTSSNFEIANKRLQSLTRKLETDLILKQQYAELMQEYIEKNHVEIILEAPQNDPHLFYLPHHAVKKMSNEETKWRIVFDASSHPPGHPSLNDALEPGPNLLPEILATLLRFRLSEIAITCDGQKAFLQLILAKEDRNATRFLWNKTTRSPDGTVLVEDEILTYRFTRLPFGLTSSPFLLTASLRELIDMYKEEYPTATKHLENNIYMDDCILGAHTDDEAIDLYQETQQLMSQISLPLAKWTTNSKVLQDVWNQENLPYKTLTHVLGVNWNTNSDTFENDVGNKICQTSSEPVTKRVLLKQMSRFYDPLGLYAPVVVVIKILFQDTWLKGIQWNEVLPPVVAEQYYTWINQLPCLSDISIPRWIGYCENSEFTIHVFCDASERAYGACLYSRSTNNSFTSVNLICSRSKLAPVKKVTLPRLELLAALLGARLLQYFCKETNITSSTATLWSDSTVTLSWIQGYPNRWKTFVCNRTTEILQHTTPAQWRHCPGTDNPADYISRGTLPSQLKNLDLWWHGPKWLVQEPETWPTKDSSTNSQPLVEVELKKKEFKTFYVASAEPIIDISRYSSYIKLLRVTAWILRFVHNCKTKQRTTEELTSIEIDKAKDYWIRTVQQQSFSTEIDALKNGHPLPKNSKIACFNPFIKEGLLRLGGRLQYAKLTPNTQHPLLLDGSHPFVHLLIQYTHVRLHHLGVRIVLSELRSTYWILKGRQIIKQVLHKCLPCKLLKAKCGQQIEAPLPFERVVPCSPFETTGIDFAGPVNVRKLKSHDTAYIALFTCSTTRAIHIELVSDLTTDRFLQAFQRFVSRRGLPKTIYTDNATTFHAANKELNLLWETLASAKTQQYYAHNGIIWKFIAPRAAWWGGWWERLIRIIKQCLRKVVGRSLLDEESLITVLTGIEAALNSRPLVYESSEDDTVLTPAHFLTGRKLTTIKSHPVKQASPIPHTKLTKLYHQQQDLLEHFWAKWSKEYLLQLRSFHQVRNHSSTTNIRVGDVVLLHEDVRPRHMWKKARIIKLHQGRDGNVRSCTLKANNKEITRPIQLVIPLEIDQGGEDVARRCNDVARRCNS